MKKLNAQISQLGKAAARLEEALALKPTRINKDATLQRFEFTFELAWKVMKGIAEIKGLEEAVSPKDSIRIAAQLGLIGEVLLWFDFLDARNTASHIYNEEMANTVYKLVKEKFPKEVKNLLKEVKQSISKL